MKIQNFSMNEKRRLFLFIMTGSQVEIWKLIEGLSLPLRTDVNYKKITQETVIVSFKCASEEDYKELYQKIDDIILEYI